MSSPQADAERRPITIVCVCTGNVCRSPVAERLLSAALGPQAEVSSAGIGALEGYGISSPMDRLLLDAGADASDFRARWLDQRMLREADLVLGMTVEHRAAAVELWPALVRRAFTLKELARLVGGVDLRELPPGSSADRLRTLARLASGRRSRAPEPGADDVVDPFGRGEDAYRQAFDEIQRAVESIMAVARS